VAVAFLVLAHDQPAHLARLIEALAGGATRFFVHVDAKVDVAPFRTLIGARPDVELVARRVAVHWGGFSIVRATLELLAASAGRFTRHCLLSGADYPIKPRADVLAALEDEHVEWMSVGRMLGPDDPQRAYVEHWHWNDWPLLNPRGRPPGRLARRARRVLRPLAERLGSGLPPRRFPGGLVPYKGSQWWALSDACVQWMREYLRAHPEYERFHRHVHCPDEIFFHSLVQASPFASRLGGRPLHCIEWQDARPRVLGDDDFAALTASPALFARKFAEGRSRGVLARLDDVLGLGSVE
jgi:hypothetical protein